MNKKTAKTQYRFPLTQYGMAQEPDGKIWLIGKIGEQQVGLLVLKAPEPDGTRPVFQVWTDKQYRGLGVASHLWKIAKASKLNPKHDTHQTEDGMAWAERVGG